MNYTAPKDQPSIEELLAANKKNEEAKAFIKECDDGRKAEYLAGDELDYQAVYHKLDELRDYLNSAAEFVRYAEDADDAESKQDYLHDASSDLAEWWHVKDIHNVLWDYAESIDLGEE